VYAIRRRQGNTTPTYVSFPELLGSASATIQDMTPPAEEHPHPLRVVVAGGGIAAAEVLLALRDLAADRVSLTLVSPSDELVIPALSVAEPFAMGHAQRYALADLLTRVGGDLVAGALATVDAPRREIGLTDGQSLGFDALVIAIGARAVARVEHATTWWPGGDPDTFGGLLRDLEEGYTKRVAFVIPPGAVWPLPLYELALMTAREVSGMGIDDAQLTVITPEAVPLTLFGSATSTALREELDRAGVALHTATVARVAPADPLEVVLQPSTRRLGVDRVVALPGVDGPRIPGTTYNDAGFILVGPHGRMHGADCVWAAGDAIAYPVKFGGLASQQADAVAAQIAAQIAAHAGTQPTPPPTGLKLRGVLMTGATPRAMGAAAEAAPTAHPPLWRPEAKVFGTYLTPYLQSLQPALDADTAHADGVIVEEALPEVGSDAAQAFHL
jgi:sulfide:quinone oxidoreductase